MSASDPERTFLWRVWQTQREAFNEGVLLGNVVHRAGVPVRSFGGSLRLGLLYEWCGSLHRGSAGAAFSSIRHDRA